MGQKKKVGRPSHPIPSPIRQYKLAGTPGTPWREEKYDISVSLNFFRIPILKKAPKYLLVLPVRARLATARARLGFSDFRLSDFPIIQMSNFPIFQLSEFLISNYPNFRFSNFPVFQFSDFPNLRFPNFQFSNFPNFPFFDFSNFRI